MIRLLAIVSFHSAILSVWTGAGLFMLLAPACSGNFVHHNFNLFPEVNPCDWGKQLVVRVLGIGLLAFAVRFAIPAAHLAI
jgi:hypothetical protein